MADPAHLLPRRTGARAALFPEGFQAPPHGILLSLFLGCGGRPFGGRVSALSCPGASSSWRPMSESPEAGSWARAGAGDVGDGSQLGWSHLPVATTAAQARDNCRALGRCVSVPTRWLWLQWPSGGLDLQEAHRVPCCALSCAQHSAVLRDPHRSLALPTLAPQSLFSMSLGTRWGSREEAGR